MIKAQISLVAFLTLFTLPGCTKVVYTTGQVLSNYKTQDEVLNRFGIPTIKREEGSITEWIYYYGSIDLNSQLTSDQVNANATVSGNSIYGNAYGSRNRIGISTTIDRYIKYTFDRNGHTTRYAYQGVDLEERKKLPAKLLSASSGATVLFVGLVIALASGGGYSE